MTHKPVILSLALGAVLLLQSCVSVRNEPAPPRLEATKASMEAYIAKDELANGLSAWSRARNQAELPPEFLEKYANDLGGLLNRKAKLLIDEGKESLLPQKIKAFNNLASFSRFTGLVPAEDWVSLGEAGWKEWIRSLAGKGFSQTALMCALEKPDVLRKDPALQNEMLRIAREIPNAWAVRQLTDSAGESRQIDPAQVLKACVTVWVDRGIKVERGLGVPDVVIGSAFFIERDGYLLTNYHVISSEVDPQFNGVSRLYIRPGKSDSEKIPAKVVGWDPVFDLALLKVEITAPALVPLSNLGGISTGTRVMAFGSPGGLDNSVTAGITSNADRRLLAMGDVMQIDAPVNPGNSGGPLLTEDGTFIGIVFAGIPQFQGINFSVPAHWIADLLPVLAQGGKITHPWLGLRLFEFRNQVKVLYVVPGSPAWQMGIKQGDVLTGLNGHAIKTIADAYLNINRLSAGDLVSLEWRSGGKALLDTVNMDRMMAGLVVFAERSDYPLEKAAKSGLSLSLLAPLFGFSAVDITVSSLIPTLKVTEVVPGSTADELGLSIDDTVRVLDWVVDSSQHGVFMIFDSARRTRGYLKQTMQMGASLESENFL